MHGSINHLKQQGFSCFPICHERHSNPAGAGLAGGRKVRKPAIAVEKKFPSAGAAAADL
jgi:hypothetical protein